MKVYFLPFSCTIIRLLRSVVMSDTALWWFNFTPTAAEAVSYATMAQEFGLAASRGSDFHSPEESRTDLGALPPLPSSLQPVWELLAGRILPAPAPRS